MLPFDGAAIYAHDVRSKPWIMLTSFQIVLIFEPKHMPKFMRHCKTRGIWTELDNVLLLPRMEVATALRTVRVRMLE